MHVSYRQGNPQELYLKSLEAIGIDTKVRVSCQASSERLGRVWNLTSHIHRISSIMFSLANAAHRAH